MKVWKLQKHVRAVAKVGSGATYLFVTGFHINVFYFAARAVELCIVLA